MRGILPWASSPRQTWWLLAPLGFCCNLFACVCAGVVKVFIMMFIFIFSFYHLHLPMSFKAYILICTSFRNQESRKWILTMVIWYHGVYLYIYLYAFNCIMQSMTVYTMGSIWYVRFLEMFTNFRCMCVWVCFFSICS